jgi:putative transposase
LLSPSRRRACVAAVCEGLGVSERRACRVLGQYHTTQRHAVQHRPDKESLTAAIVELATRYGRYGYRRITALLRQAGWTVHAKRVPRIWRQEGLKVPLRQPKRGRLWLNDGSCIRLRPEAPNHVWGYDFLTDRTHDARAFRLFTIVDEFTRECVVIVVRGR